MATVSDSPDLELARAAAAGDGAAWNDLVARFGDTILGASMGWCEGGCRIPRGDYDCILRTIRAERPEPGETPDGCREGLLLYRHACTELKQRLGGFDGTTSLEAFVLAALAEIRRDYLVTHRGRLGVPGALADASPLARDVYRSSCRVASRSDVAGQLGVDEAAVRAAEDEVARAMASAGLPWWGLEPMAASAPTFEGPVWVHRGVQVGGDAPEPVRKGDTWLRRALSQPDWLMGLVVGGVTSALCLLVVIPHEDYSKSVREPGDQLLARANSPLEPPLATKLANARASLASGRVDAALLDLNAILALRGDNQEARWLLATTYDRLGDQARAAKHYKLFLDVAGKTRDATDSRMQHAEARLGHYSELP